MNLKNKLKMVKMGDIKPYAKNAKKHPQAQIDLIVDSLKNNDYYSPLGINEDGELVIGHGRYEALKQLKSDDDLIEVVDFSYLDKKQIKKLRIMDNKIVSDEWDKDLLEEELKAIVDESDGDLEELANEMGLSDKELSSILPDEETVGDDDVPEDAPSITKEGDLWELGEHRLLCGDSTKEEDVDRLMDGQKMDLVHTDPPYGINEKGDRSKRGGLTEGNKLEDFVDDSIDYAIKAYDICQKLDIKRQVWWGANYYCHHLPQGNNWFVWDKRVEEKQTDTQSDCELAWVKSKWSSVRIFRHLWKGMMKDSERGQRRVHPTQKPVELFNWVLEYFRDVNAIMDLFTGSGSNLISCEKNGKSFFGMEFSPHYCDVIVQRYKDFCEKNNKPVIIKRNGEIYDGESAIDTQADGFFDKNVKET